jgi:hypothetical protein
MVGTPLRSGSSSVIQLKPTGSFCLDIGSIFSAWKSTTIPATLGAITGSTTLTVAANLVSLTPANVSIMPATPCNPHPSAPTAIPARRTSEGHGDVEFQSHRSGHQNGSGLASSVALGTTNIAATLGAISGGASLTVQ